MTSRWQTSLRLCASSVWLVLFLAGCVNPPEPSQPPPAPPAAVLKPDAAVALPLETIRSICLAWFNTLPTWQDLDAEQTKDEIDLSIRTNEDVCTKYLAGA